ncbi:helix-turn-helix domain-containing protein [Streptomyces sp. NPDC090057]|uniref:helix-turn-helix domain-containing protein n=1 Tax=Streptomyces sp. NPDC090057 TaxID=3365935 RepID=UPI00382B391E
MPSWRAGAGWLLRVHRQCHGDAGLRGLRGFAQALAAKNAEVSPSSISRWETGRTAVDRSVVRRYEDVLGLPSHHLLSVIDTMARYDGGRSAVAFLRRSQPTSTGDRAAGRRLDALLDRVLDGDILAGDDWDDLTALVTAPGVLTGPRRVRQSVAQRLLEEMLVSDGVAWRRRYEAFGRLMADDVWAADAVEACEGVLACPAHAGLIEVVSMLEASPHPQAARQTLLQLTDPLASETFYGALLASHRKNRRRHFSGRQAEIVAEVVSGVLKRTAGRLEAEAAAALLHQLPLPPTRVARIAEAAYERPVTRNIVRHGCLVEPHAARVVLARMTARISDGPRPAPDATLRGIIDDVLHHPVADVRLYTAMLLDASPYGSAVAEALCEELLVPGTVQVTERAVPALYALGVLGGPDQRPAVARLTLARGLAPEVEQAAVHALGHIGGRSPAGYWQAALRRLDEHWRQQPGPTARTALKRFVYSAAMSGELDLLRRLATTQAQSEPLRSLSGWWVELARAVRESACV